MEQNSLQYKTYIRRIIFINSATMNEEVLMMDGNIFLNGTNNVGKSSILKGLTYFQGNSPNNMNYDKGELFIPFYFPDAASYIIQEIHKSDGTLYCLVHYASGGVFVLGSYESLRAFIIDSEGYVTPKKELVKRFREANITFFDTTVERWRNIYYGNKKSFDSGHAYCTGSGEGAVFKKWIGNLASGNAKVAYILRLKSRTHYRVQTGAFTTKTELNKHTKLLTSKKIKYELKTVGANTVVQVGYFSGKENAQRWAADFTKKYNLPTSVEVAV